MKIQVKAAREVLDFARSDDKDFDLNQIVPTPNTAASKTLDLLHGIVLGNDWFISHWGVRQNTQDSVRTKPQFVKFTANGLPLPALITLSEFFPEETIRVKWKQKGSREQTKFLKNGKELDSRDHSIIYGLLDVALLKVGDKVKRSVVNERTYHAEVSYVANDLKEVRFTGVKFVEADGSTVADFVVAGRVESYTAIEFDGEVHVSVNQKISRWQKDE